MTDLDATTLRQLVRYGIVGLLSNIAGYLVYLLITSIGGSPKVTMTLLYVLGAGLSFLGNRRLTFAYEGNMNRAVLRYAIVHSVGYLINWLILCMFVDKLEYPHQLVQIVAVFVVAAYLFAALRLYVFAAGATLGPR